jgi:hypothetical protein
VETGIIIEAVVGKATKEKEEREVETEEVLLVVIDQDSLETWVTA